jgi:hypothetical protein
MNFDLQIGLLRQVPVPPHSKNYLVDKFQLPNSLHTTRNSTTAVWKQLFGAPNSRQTTSNSTTVLKQLFGGQILTSK